MSNDAEASRPTAVLDSNVLLSGFAYSRGVPYEIVNALRTGEIYVYISPFILDEVSRNLGRAFGLREAAIEEVLVFLRSRCTVLDTLPTLSLVELSPNDNRVLDCAVQGQAQYLVTGDREFLRLRQLQGVRIINPRDFLTLLRQG